MEGFLFRVGVRGGKLAGRGENRRGTSDGESSRALQRLPSEESPLGMALVRGGCCAATLHVLRSLQARRPPRARTRARSRDFMTAGRYGVPLTLATCSLLFARGSAGRLRAGEGAKWCPARGIQRRNALLHVSRARKRAALRREDGRVVPGLPHVRSGRSHVSRPHSDNQCSEACVGFTPRDNSSRIPKCGVLGDSSSQCSQRQEYRKEGPRVDRAARNRLVVHRFPPPVLLCVA